MLFAKMSRIEETNSGNGQERPKKETWQNTFERNVAQKTPSQFKFQRVGVGRRYTCCLVQLCNALMRSIVWCGFELGQKRFSVAHGANLGKKRHLLPELMAWVILKKACDVMFPGNDADCRIECCRL